jgi:hypothetical protein
VAVRFMWGSITRGTLEPARGFANLKILSNGKIAFVTVNRATES